MLPWGNTKQGVKDYNARSLVYKDHSVAVTWHQLSGNDGLYLDARQYRSYELKSAHMIFDNGRLPTPFTDTVPDCSRTGTPPVVGEVLDISGPELTCVEGSAEVLTAVVELPAGLAGANSPVPFFQVYHKYIPIPTAPAISKFCFCFAVIAI